MARRKRPTLAEADALADKLLEARNAQQAAEADRDKILAEARDFGRRQIAMRRSVEQYVVALQDFNAGRQRLRGIPRPDEFGSSAGLLPQGIPGTPTPNNPDPKLRWYQRRRGG